MKKRLHILFMALLAMAVLGGCGADGTGASSEDTSSKEQNVQETEISEGPVYGGSVVVGIQQDIDSLDPHKATAAGTKEILFNVFAVVYWKFRGHMAGCTGRLHGVVREAVPIKETTGCIIVQMKHPVVFDLIF